MRKSSFAAENDAQIMSFRTKTQASSALQSLPNVPATASPVRFDFGGIVGVRWVLRTGVTPTGGEMLSVNGEWVNYTTHPWRVIFTTYRDVEVVTTHYSRSEAVSCFRSTRGTDEESFTLAVGRYKNGAIYDPSQRWVEGVNLQSFRLELLGVI
jgi:hypothetical protein